MHSIQFYKLQELKNYFNDPLYKNSFYIIITRALNAGTGFIFWMVAARLYSMESMGLSIALISGLELVKLLSNFGFSFSLIRFLPVMNKKNVFNTCLNICIISSLLIGMLYITWAAISPSGLSSIQKAVYVAIFLFFTIIGSMTSIMGNTFMALREGLNYFLQNVILVLRVPLLFPMTAAHSLGVFVSNGFAMALASLFSLIRLNSAIGLNFRIDKQFIKESIHFSSGNYAANVFLEAPVFILPIMVLKLLGEAEAAKYYIAFAIGNMFLLIPEAVSTSLFIEGSHGVDLKKNFFRAIHAVYFCLIPAAVAVYFLGGYILVLFGKYYVDALQLLKMLVLSSLVVVIYLLFIAMQNVRMKVKQIVFLNLLRFILILGLSYIFILKFGIVGVGYAFVTVYAVLSVGVAVFLMFDSKMEV